MLISERARSAAGSHRRGTRLAATAVAESAMAALALAAGMTPAFADRVTSPGTAATGAAFGLAATGAIKVLPVPTAASASAQRAYGSLASRTAGPLLGTAALSVEAGTGYARASVTRLAALRSALSAEAVTAECANGRGSVRLVGASFAGRRLIPDPAPNTVVPVYLHRIGAANVTLNKQTWQPDRRLTVTGLSVSVRLAGNELQTFDIASATCGCAGKAGSSGEGSGPPSALPPGAGTGAGTGGPPGVPPGTSSGTSPEGGIGTSPGTAGGTEPDGGTPVAGPGTAQQAEPGTAGEASAPAPVRGALAVTG